MANSTDKMAPKLLATTPKAGSATVTADQNLVLTFSESIKIGTGNIVISNGKDIHKIAITDKSQITISGKTLTINPAKDLLSGGHYNVNIAATAIKDLAGNKYAGLSNKNTLSFNTVDTLAPTLTAASPGNGHKLVSVNRNLEFMFNEKIQAGSGNLILSNGMDIRTIPINDPQITIKNNKLTLNPDLDLQQGGSTYNVRIENGAIKDLTGNAFAGNGDGFNFNTNYASVTDTIAPFLARLLPNDNATAVAVDANLKLIFNESINIGTGNIVISNDSDIRTISISDPQVTINNNVLVVNPTTDFLNGDYNVQIAAGVITDKANNPFAGFTTATAFNFTVGSKTVLTGKAIDGYLKGATVFADANGNGVLDAGEATTTTDANGDFTLTNAKGAIIASGGVDLSTGKEFKGTLKAPEGSTVVTPLTTVQQGFVEAGQTVAEAQQSVAKAFGFDSTKVNLATYDPIAELLKPVDAGSTGFANTLATQMMASTAQIANFLVTAGQVLQGAAGGNDKLSTQTAGDALVKSLVTAIQTSGEKKIDLADSVLLKTVLVAGAKESATKSTGESVDFEAKIGKMADSVSTIMKDAADNITSAVTKGGNGSNLLNNMGKVSAFTQNDVGASLNTTAKTFDPKSATAISALTTQTTSLTGTAAQASIANKMVELPSGATLSTTTDPHAGHIMSTTPNSIPVDEHIGHTESTKPSSTPAADSHSGHTDTSSSSSTSAPSDPHAEHTESTTLPIIVASISALTNSGSANTTMTMSMPGTHTHSSAFVLTSAETSTQAGFTVMLDHPAPTGGLTIKYELDGTAQRNSDYTVAAGTNVSALTTKTFTIAAGQTGATLNVNVNYSAIKDTEAVQLRLLSGSGYQTGQNGVSTLAFDDSDSYVTGANPSAVAAGDFNGDGKLDLAVANPNANSVSILLRNASNSGFIAKVDVETGTTPVAISTGDFNGDGKTDFAVANLNGSVSVFVRNAANSGFDKTDISTGRMANAISSGDFNSDGKTDLVVTNGLTNAVSILVRNAANSDFDKTDLTTALAPEAVSVGDFNGDGKLDVVTAGDSKMSVLLQNADGSFAAKTDYPTGRGASSVTVGDFDGDGKQDVATANMRDNTVSVLLNNGSGFATKTDVKVGAKPTSLKAADLNGDDKIDLAVLNQAGNVVSVLLRNADNTGFVQKIDYVTDSGNESSNFDAYPNALTVGDFNGDGQKDIAVANQNGNSVSVLENSSNAIVMIAPIQVSVMPAAETMEGDTGNFMIMLDAPAPANGLKVNFTVNGSATLTTDYSLSSGTDTTLNNDGSFTIAAGKMSAMLNVVTVNDQMLIDDHETINLNLTAGTGYQIIERSLFAEKAALATTVAPWAVSAGDFNADGGDDLIIANEESGVISVLLQNEKIDFTESTSAVTTGDFNKDGYADFAFVNTANNSLSVVLRKADNSGFENKMVYQTGINPTQIQSGDFNGDGYADLVTGNSNGRVSVLFWNAQTSGFSTKSDYVVGTSGSISAIQVADFNGDGKEDLAVANYEAHNVSVLFAKVTGGFDTAARYTTGSSPYLGAGDLNGDGFADLVIANNDSNSVSVILRNAGNTAFETAQNYTVGAKPAAINIADFNGDGLADISVVNSGDDTISVLLRSVENLGFEERIDFATAGGAVQAALGDFNADGRMDLAASSATENSVSMLMNDSTFMSVHDYFIMMSGMMNGGGGMDMGGGSTGGMGGMTGGGMSGMGGMGGMMM